MFLEYLAIELHTAALLSVLYEKLRSLSETAFSENLFILSVVDCGNPSSSLAANGITFSGATPGPTTYGTSYSVVCTSGYIWSSVSTGQDYTSSRSITCQASGTWSAVSSCIGILKLYFRYTPSSSGIYSYVTNYRIGSRLDSIYGAELLWIRIVHFYSL